MKLAVALSAVLHALVLAAVLARWHWQPAGPAEVPAQIAMVFGRNALTQGAPASPARTVAPATAPVTPDPVPPDPVPPAPAAVSTPSVAPSPLPAAPRPASPPTPDAAPPSEAAQSVRLGDGMVGFDVPTPDADIIEAQGVPSNRPPPPPEAAFARGEHGRVVLRIHVRADGRVGSIDTLESSGYLDLDASAIDAARRWHFIPQLRDGQAVESSRDQPFDFELK